MEADHEALRRRYGSPLYVYELGDVRAAFQALRAALPNPSVLLYSLKANPHPRLVAELARLGCGAEVSSPGELAAALAAGVAAERCLYTGPGKSRAEIDAALRSGVTRFSVESPADMRKVEAGAAALGRSVEVLHRLNPGAAARGAGLAMGGASPFGSDVGHVASRPADFRPAAGAALAGFHVYAGTNLGTVALLLEAFDAALDAVAGAAAALGLSPAVVDVGGGFGHPFSVAGGRPDLAGLREPLEARLDARLPGWRRGAPAIAFESGRFLVAAAGTLVCTVEDVKTSRGTRHIVLDAGINHLGGMSGLGRLLRVEPDLALAGPAGEEAGRPAGAAERVVGPLCTPLDVLATRARLAGAAPGAMVLVRNVGAYGLTASLVGFLGRPCPVEVVLDRGRVVSASRLVLGRVEEQPGLARGPG